MSVSPLKDGELAQHMQQPHHTHTTTHTQHTSPRNSHLNSDRPPAYMPPAYPPQDVKMALAAEGDYLPISDPVPMVDSAVAEVVALGPANGSSTLGTVIPNERELELVPDHGQEVEEEMVFTWTIPSWSEVVNRDKIHGPDFVCGGARWHFFVFPSGNRIRDVASVYLDCIDAHNEPAGSRWHKCVSFSIRALNPFDPSVHSAASYAQHRFTPEATDWGFNTFIKHSALNQKMEHTGKSILEEDQFTLQVAMKVLKDPLGTLWHNFVDWDSKKETGFVGLRNQGATCYLNSLLQSLYFTSYFRKATFQIPTDNDEPVKSVPLALQRLFYNMQFTESAVGTTELTKSFGWDTTEAFYQHDVQELNRVLQDNLENKMKGTAAEGAIRKLFTGKMKSFLTCVNVNYESSRIEDFYDIQLNVKGCRTLHDSFVDYCNVEMLDGDNKYFAEGFGLQDAKKGVIFKQFPPVLHLQLKRFEYDVERDALVKTNDRHEFPLVIDLDEFLEEKDTPVKQRYHLHGVLVHIGELHAGHYCAFIRAQKSGAWFKFDDDRVIPVSEKEVLEDNYGGEALRPGETQPAPLRPGMRMHKRFTSAYMLVYIRESDLDEILSPITETDIPEHLRRRFEDERLLAERRRKDKEEAHLYMNVKLITDEVIRRHEGYDLCNLDDSRLPTASDPHLFRVLRSHTFAQFKELVAEELRVSVSQIRLWNMIGRQNKTVRPDAPVSAAEDATTMEDLRRKHIKANGDLRLYVEVADKPIDVVNGEPVYFLPRDNTVQQPFLLLFIKYYDPLQGKMEFVGTYTVRSHLARISDIVPVLLEMKGLPPSTPIQIYEEIKPGMVEILPLQQTYVQAEIGDGDILCFQREILGDEITKLPDANLLSAFGFYEYLSNRLTVTFKPKAKDAPHKGDIELVLSKKMGYDMVISKLAAALDHDPLKIRLSMAASHSMVPKSVIRRSTATTLNEMLGGSFYNPGSSIIFYEMLDVSILEFETKRYVKVLYVDEHLKEQGPFDLLIPKQAHVSDLVVALANKVGYGADPSRIRLLEVSNLRISRIFAKTDPVSIIGDYCGLIAEEICAEEMAKTADDVVVTVMHYFKEPHHPHGTPFTFVLHAGEMFGETKKRLHARTGMTDKDFGRVKFSIVSYGKVTPIEDGDILHDHTLSLTEHLGMDHTDKTGKLRGLGGTEKAIKILVKLNKDAVAAWHLAC
ncbi:hypothetical protein BC831DRAFT_473479 [Entophlyctis helioformis]|nr:hypothetical protein BC831DRAFT_473479 [Entophlyctis helioformis]